MLVVEYWGRLGIALRSSIFSIMGTRQKSHLSKSFHDQSVLKLISNFS